MIAVTTQGHAGGANRFPSGLFAHAEVLGQLTNRFALRVSLHQLSALAYTELGLAAH